MSQSAPAIIWFREDLRLTDNPALHAAVSSGRPLVLLYILDEQTKGLRPLGGASKWWLDKSLRALAADIKQAGAQLTLRSGQSADMLDTVIEETGAAAIFWNRRYDQPERDLDAAIKEDLTQRGLDVSSYNARLLNEPWQGWLLQGVHPLLARRPQQLPRPRHVWSPQKAEWPQTRKRIPRRLGPPPFEPRLVHRF
nr:deoxyribodipyrimidine photo-lyase [Hyphomonas sp. L-53-1-40]